ncbi:MAG: nucleoside-diphosphate sugar epimerase [Fluviicola sp.]|nr:MAG: nucleoside-diphosphate sugar epimerase [Fluviicola sp.]
MQKTAIILGATGLTGSLLLEQLLTDTNYSTIKLFSRTPSGISHPKVKEYIGDLLHLETFTEDLTGDEIYICIGTTKKKTPDSNLYRKIDLGIPSQAASICKANGVSKLSVVSAIGANSKSSIPYNKIKGEMEEAVMGAEIEHTYILRPSFITGNRQEQRAGEKMVIAVFKFFKFLIPKKYRAVEAKAIAAKMIQLCNSNEPSRIIESSEI